ncbi:MULTISPECIES: tetratricopeptide repeat protein [unclassified Phenylobacterium]|uniref:tetratricopeptide repeat protein n=1 Tax=unclassified Phenylobacterium TaxID=2640670 RepID=UPI0022B4AE6B|nr:tetratricopeptide repeat protein [Phenylobacterium sp. NIBR 498073]WGU38280.1 tetratricopeptide repeat protein [Phenylobacterium sp. NIBR 498073]
MVDVFDEVEEQLRSERYKSIALRVLPILGGVLVVALVAALAVWGYQHFRSQAAAEASEKYAQAIEAFNAGRRDDAIRLWGEVGQGSSKAYKSLALQHLGGLKVADNKTAEAVKLFDEAAEAAPNNIIGDAARLKSAFALLDTAPYKDMEARLTPLTEEGRPYRAEAREALAFAKLMAGDLAGARSDFTVIGLMADAGEGSRQRAEAAKALIDSGSAKALPATVKAAMALPPPVQLPPGAVPPGLAPQGAPQPAAPQQSAPGAQ